MATTHTATIRVREPNHDPWVIRIPTSDEKPQENQFYARNDKDEGTLFYNGNLVQESYDSPLSASADSVFLRLYAEDKLVKTVSQRLPSNKAYALTVKLHSGLIRYRVEFGAKRGAEEATLRTVKNSSSPKSRDGFMRQKVVSIAR